MVRNYAKGLNGKLSYQNMTNLQLPQHTTSNHQPSKRALSDI